MRNDSGLLIWSISDFVQSRPNDLAKVSYDYDGQGVLIQYKDNQRSLIMIIDKVGNIFVLSLMSTAMSSAMLSAMFSATSSAMLSAMPFTYPG